MTWLRDFEQLSALCRHKEPKAKKWAMEKLALLYRDRAGDAAFMLLDDKDPGVVSVAASALQLLAAGEHRDRLLEAYRRLAGENAGKIGDALARLDDSRLVKAFQEKYASLEDRKADPAGYAMSVTNIARLQHVSARGMAMTSLLSVIDDDDLGPDVAADLFAANLTAGADPRELLSLCFDRPDTPGLLADLLAVVMDRCGKGYGVTDLDDESERRMFKRDLPRMVENSLSIVQVFGLRGEAVDLQSLYKKGKYSRVVEQVYSGMEKMLAVVKAKRGEEAVNAEMNDISTSGRAVASLTALSEQVGNAPAAFRDYLARTCLALYAGLLQVKELIGVALDDLAAEELLNVLLADRYTVDEDGWIIAELASSGERQSFAAACSAHIADDPESQSAERAAQLLARTGDEKSLRTVLEKAYITEEVWAALKPAITALGPRAVDALTPLLDGPDATKADYALEALAYVPCARAADLLLERWETLWATHKESLLAAVEGIADRRFPEPLKKELREGEIQEAEAYILLCLLNRVADPLAKKLEKQAEDYAEKMKRRLKLVHEGGVDALMREPLEVELKCRSCGKSYHYEAAKIVVDPETHDRIIMDEIRCKNCGVFDNYEITKKGDMAIMGATIVRAGGLTGAQGNKDLREATVVIGKTAPIDGKRRSIADALAHYEKMIESDPKNAAHRIGYANVLRAAKRSMDAERSFRAAIELDPLAVDGYLGLAQFAERKGDLGNAHELYKKTADIFDRGSFYRLQQDKDCLKEQVLDSLFGLEEKLDLKPAAGSEPAGIIKTPKVGRNDPCPCRSGKKYKKCCLGKEHEKAAAPAPDYDEKRIAERLDAYTHHKRFKPDLLSAVALYWRTEAGEPLVLPEGVADDRGEFQEWYMLDHLLSTGKTIVEEFYAEQYNRLSPVEREILEAHMMSYKSLYEVLDVEQGKGFKARDILTGQEVEVKEVKGTYQIVKWDILFLRLYTREGATRILTSSPTVVPRRLKDDLVAYLTKEFDIFRQETGKADWRAFLKRRSYAVEHFLLDRSGERPVILTEERHPVVLAKARFDLKDMDVDVELLEKEYDFVVNEYKPGKEANLSWLKRGKSKDRIATGTRSEHGLVMQSKLMHDSGKMEWTVLGGLTISPGKLLLECLSRERLEFGKERLREVLGNLAVHKADTYEDMEQAVERARASGRPEKEYAPSEAVQRLLAQQLSRQYEQWIDEKLPALEGKTPREAVKTPEGRQRVLALLKDIENAEERSKKEGRLYLDVAVLRKELGLE